MTASKSSSRSSWLVFSVVSLLLFSLLSFLLHSRDFVSMNGRIVFGLIGFSQYFSFILTIIALAILYNLFSLDQAKKAAVFGLIVGAALSNALDRIIYGGALDYLNLPLIPTFNLQDVFIVGGLIYLFYYKLKTE